MTKFALFTSIMSLVLLGGFIGLSIWRFGLLKSYSGYAKKWTEFIPMHNVNVWSIVNVIVAILLMPALIERAQGNPLQCLGFLVPIYLIAVALTPRYESDSIQMWWHFAFTFCCAIGFIAYVCLGLHLWYVPLICLAAFFLLIAFPTKSIKTSYVLWIECALFSTAYVVTFIPGAV